MYTEGPHQCLHVSRHTCILKANVSVCMSQFYELKLIKLGINITANGLMLLVMGVWLVSVVGMLAAGGGLAVLALAVLTFRILYRPWIMGSSKFVLFLSSLEFEET